MFTKLGRVNAPMAPRRCLVFLGVNTQGWSQGGVKIVGGGASSTKDFLFRLEQYRNILNAQQ